ncbi:lactadherin-like [Paramormyrops kingsleyae]|nr:lactadherin-like [Paramormyrops kingsleyae]
MWKRRLTHSFSGVPLCILMVAVCAVFGEYCEVNKCHNGGTCVTRRGSPPFFCVCPDGFGGETCNTTEIGPCNPNPCKHGGICEVTNGVRRGDVFSEYVCKCQEGFLGIHCQKSLSDCAGRPCKNGGVCRTVNGVPGCHCPSPHVGKYCQFRCISLLGMEKGGIAESQISASSVHYGILGLQRWGPELARLNNKGLVNAWTAASYDKSPWIEVNLRRKMRLTGIVTQGASRMGTAEFIKAFKVASSLDGRTYSVYQLEGQLKDNVFTGNVDNDGIKTNLFDPPILAQYLRILPVVCRRACTLRMELVGCELNGCSEPLGVKSLLIPDSQLTASSVYRTWGIEAFTWYPYYARLDRQGKTNAWTAATNSRSEWFQVDLEKPKRISGIITQGAKDFGVVRFVSAFKVAYSTDGQTWSVIEDPETKTDKIFPGNSDNNTHKKNFFEPTIWARFVRVLPWTWHERITLRLELLGCDE